MRRRWVGVAVALLVVCLGLALLGDIPKREPRAPIAAVPDAPREAPGPDRPGPWNPPLTSAPIRLSVDVVLWSSSIWTVAEPSLSSDDAILPSRGAAWPDGRSSELLQRVMFSDEDFDPDEVESLQELLVETAEGDGLFEVDPAEMDDPWDGMIALWMHYLIAEDPNDLDWAWMVAQIEGVIALDPSSTPAGALQHALAAIDGYFYDVDLDTEAFVDLVDHPDPAVARGALHHVMRHGTLPESDLREVEVPEDMRLEFVREALETAVRRDDLEAVRHWADTLEQTPEATDRDLADVEELRGRLAARGLGQPTGWREELLEAVWRCHGEAVFVGDRTLVYQVDLGRWQAASTDGEPVPRCLEDFQPSEGPERVIVELTIHDPFH